MFRTLKVQDVMVRRAGRRACPGGVAAIAVLVDSKNLLLPF